MTELMRSWVMGITAASMLGSIALAVTPEGKVRRVTKLTASVLCILVLLGPVMSIDPDELSGLNVSYGVELTSLDGRLKDENILLEKSLIEEACAEYISDKGSELGAALKVRVTAELGDDGRYYPKSAEITAADASAVPELTRIIERELGITEERQSWSYGDV